jgi:hypothetical protein
MTIECIGGTEGASSDVEGCEVGESSWMGRDVGVLDQEQALLNDFYLQALDKINAIRREIIKAHYYHLLECNEEVTEELIDEYAEAVYHLALHHPSNREFALFDPNNHEVNIQLCKGWLKSTINGAKKGVKTVGKVIEKTGKGIKKGAKKTYEFVKEHKVEVIAGAVLITAVIVTAGLAAGPAGASIAGASAAGAGAAGTGAAGAGAVGAGAAAVVAAAAAGQGLGNSSRRKDEENGTPATEGIAAASPPNDPPKDFNSIFNNLTLAQTASINPITIKPLTPPVSLPPSPETKSGNQSAFFDFQRNNWISQNPLAEAHKGDINKTPLSPSLEFQQNKWLTPGSLAEIHKNIIDKTPLIPPLDLGKNKWLSPNPLFEVHKNDIDKTLQIRPPSVAPLPPLGMFPFSMGQGISELGNNSLRITGPLSSCRIGVEGIRLLCRRIGVINGMNTSIEDAIEHLKYIQQFTNGMAIDGVYNRTNGIVGDLAEIFFLNYGGFAPNTKELLIKQWTQFYEEYKDDPSAKYLQIAVSMGTILTRNALMDVPQEIRDRVIVISIGPAIVIPKNLCYQTVSYASRSDPVNLAENLCAYICSGAASNDNRQSVERYAKMIEHKKDLILLKSHEDCAFYDIDHNFQSPTFSEVLQNQIEMYLEKGIIVE